MIRVLFVDDEPEVLEGLENRLRRLKGQWQAGFATSGERALLMLTAEVYDAVVTDMRMPQMDGGALLRSVRREFPNTVRIILSGDIGEKGLIRAISVAHRVLSKPCDIDQLHEIIVDTMRVQAEFGRDPVLLAADAPQPLPSAPKLFAALQAQLRRPDVDLNTLAKTIERDPAITARLLQIVNSAMFGYGRVATDVREAIRRLGLNLICSLAAADELYRDASHGHPQLRRQIEQLQALSSLTAEFAISLCEDPLKRPLVFTAAMLQGVGALALLGNGALCGVPADTDFNRISAKLMDLWGLPADLIGAVATAPHPSDDELPHPTPAGIVHLARLFALRQIGRRTTPIEAEPSLDARYLAISELTPAQLTEWEQQLASNGIANGEGVVA